MRKLTYLTVLLVSLLGCKHEDGDDIMEICDAAFMFNIVVENETDEVVVMTNKYPDSRIGWPDITIPAGEANGDVRFMLGLGPCNPETLSVDVIHDEELVLGTNIGTSAFRISVGGVDVTDQIWLRKYWTYTPGYGEETYTLTITKERLASLPPVGDDEL